MAIEKRITFNCDPSQLWQLVGTPDCVDWVPGVTLSEFDGEVRSLTMPGAGALKEKILNVDDNAMSIEYTVTESPLPLDSHIAEIQVSGTSGATEMVWKTSVTPEAYEKFIVETMDGAIAQLRSMLEGKA